MAIAMNPYNFVRIDFDRPPRRNNHRIRDGGLDHIFGWRGYLDCRLETLTPLFIGGNVIEEQQEHKRVDNLLRDGKPFIPGTSLKGAIRSVAEAAANSCLAMVGRDPLNKTPEPFQPCRDRGNLCVTCQLFGAGRGAMLTGKVSIGDGLPVQVEDGGWVTLPPLMVPKSYHAIWYSPDGKIAGRKFYYHQPGVKPASVTKSRFNKTVHLIGTGSVFAFRVKFWGLNQEELGLLAYALFLEPELRHKLGMGKPVGLGSVVISPEAVQIEEAADRYRAWAAAQATTKRLEGEHLQTFISRLTEPWRQSQAINLKDLRQILRFDPSRPVSFAYPSKQWFDTHRRATLQDLAQESGLAGE